jgi:hypothetical protein
MMTSEKPLSVGKSGESLQFLSKVPVEVGIRCCNGDRLRSSSDFDDVRVTIENGPNGGPIVTFNVREKRP